MVFVTRRKAMAGALASLVLPAARAASPEAAAPPLKDIAEARGLLYGSAVSAAQLAANDDFTALVLAECGCIVPEWEMKWGETSEEAGQDDYSAPDHIVEFAARNGLAVRGQNLLWAKDSPDWFDALSSRQSAEAAVTRHIIDVCTRYRGRIFCWDVVNEPINVGDGRSDALRSAVFLERLGPDYIDLAHHLARATDATARLVVNEYGIEYDTPAQNRKRAALLRLLERMKRAGTPVDTVGIEGHLATGRASLSQPKLREFFSEIVSMGLDIHITELDVNDEHSPGLVWLRDQLVADEYERFLDVVLDEPAVKVVVSWGLSDRYSWLNHDEDRPLVRPSDRLPHRPLPYDNTLVRKPAWNAIARAFEGARTRPARASAPVAPARGSP